MAGRAGRRGLDAVGTVVIAAWEDVPGEGELRSLLTGVMCVCVCVLCACCVLCEGAGDDTKNRVKGCACMHPRSPFPFNTPPPTHTHQVAACPLRASSA